jgi:hypothetical protein
VVSVIVLSFVIVGFSNLRLRRSTVATTAARCATPEGFARGLLHLPVGHYPDQWRDRLTVDGELGLVRGHEFEDLEDIASF